MRHKNISPNHGLKAAAPIERDVAKDNSAMPEELRELGKRLRCTDIVRDKAELDAELMEVWDE